MIYSIDVKLNESITVRLSVVSGYTPQLGRVSPTIEINLSHHSFATIDSGFSATPGFIRGNHSSYSELDWFVSHIYKDSLQITVKKAFNHRLRIFFFVGSITNEKNDGEKRSRTFLK
jgi:hypothetical protein